MGLLLRDKGISDVFLDHSAADLGAKKFVPQRKPAARPFAGTFLSKSTPRSGHTRYRLWSVQAITRCRRDRRYFVFNTVFGIVSHYLLNRDLFVAKGSVLARHGGQMVDLFLKLINHGEAKRYD